MPLAIVSYAWVLPGFVFVLSVATLFRQLKALGIIK